MNNSANLILAYGGDVPRTSVHKHNSLDHYKLARARSRASSRPQTAGSRSSAGRPQTAARTRPVTQQQQTRELPRRPQSAGARFPSMGSNTANAKITKTPIQSAIDGDTGPPMTGVSTYPYSRLETPYLNDFRALVASTVTHPFMSITAFNRSSCPHDLLRGMAFDDGKLGGVSRWKTECARAFVAKSYEEAVRAHANGLRSEEMMFVG